MSDLRAQLLTSLHNFEGHMSLNRAMDLVNMFEAIYAGELQNREDKSYADGYQAGYRSGKQDAEQPTSHELNRLRDIEARVKAQGAELVKDIVREVGSNKKIQCIKQLREKTGLGLKDSKDIVDAYVSKLDGMYLANWERSCLDAAY
ncbi:hypothetical protein SEA_SAMISTI12_254 [Streptomyces phage Samisti12]|jgi:ribosomal protein L7/L12|uniref:Large ribosomal subunit protein bL12 C-terminal domain-containing protein n=5 Tax=Samistivirus TaxID=2560220 RepID=A0A222YX71_9CAUD|nr:hypothetical protein FDI38_gp003 [Streptomyces phage Peebs]YP_009611419.1 hypothetical protein FDI38_gp057 [Streptomyces phage Peebs]YP_009611442.1 hypothetical protein FDI39_gp003 [Streptomyces phage Samisti12]YP_009611647.1 hypothetical protein FDI39_gp055 [Streptomyces phage Samisti12]ASR76437.1 hypothetical protein SEA_SUSHI23_4 [Streptomyces phage Sushi23]QAX95740.1 hypothetical protein SEA_TEUTSCH_3 [Streptomyces phage Teutsch]QRI46000.1 hypothetical protein SEA_CROSS_3 [Streptomyces